MDAWKVKKSNMDILMDILGVFMVIAMGMAILSMIVILA